MTSIRWDLFDLAVSTAQRVISDEDAARDVALQALTELGETATAGLVVVCARRRAKDAARAFGRRPPVYNEDMDLHAAPDSVVEQAVATEAEEKLAEAIGQDLALLLRSKIAGYTNAEIAAVLKCSEEKVRLAVAAAEFERDLKGL